MDVLNNIYDFLFRFPFFIDAVGEKGEIIFWNQKACAITGYCEEKIKSAPDPWLILYPDKFYRQSLFARASENLWDIHGEKWFITAKDGYVKDLWISLFEPEFLLREYSAIRIAVGIDKTADYEEIIYLKKFCLTLNAENFFFLSENDHIPADSSGLSDFICNKLKKLDKFLSANLY